MTDIPSPEQIEQWVELTRNAGDEDEAYAVARAGWQRYGNCVIADSDLFVSGARADIAAAKAFCASCGVVDPCLEFGLRFYTPARRSEFGLARLGIPIVWGATSTYERRNILRQRSQETD